MIQGADANHGLDSSDLNDAMDFCETAFSPMAASQEDDYAPLMQVHDMSALQAQEVASPHEARAGNGHGPAGSHKLPERKEDDQAMHLGGMRQREMVTAREECWMGQGRWEACERWWR